MTKPTSRSGERPAKQGREAAHILPRDMLLDQYYTRPDVAADLYAVFTRHFDPALHQMVEPSAGTGSFLRLLPPGSLAYDVDPKHPGIIEADFLDTELHSDRPHRDHRQSSLREERERCGALLPRCAPRERDR